MSHQAQVAEIFNSLHTGPAGFIMPNAWDAGSAMVLAAEGFKAIGTTSAGIAFSLGKQDYNVSNPALAVTRNEMFARMREIASAVRVPVNGDLEAGFGDSPNAVAETVRMAIEAGLAGGNIEDKIPVSKNLYDEDFAVARIAAARVAIGSNAFVLTARTDVLQVPLDDPLPTIIRRANLFLKAGADCVFVPGVTDLPTISMLLREIKGPINIVAGLGTAQGNAHEMIKAGVQRVSLGGSIARSALGFIRQCARELRDEGSFTFASGQMSGAEINALFAEGRDF